MVSSLLYPINSFTRQSIRLDGMWGFQTDPAGEGAEKGFADRLPAPDMIPVPSSFEDFYTEKAIRDYCGDFWYELDFSIPAEWKGRTVALRFGAATHVATVYVNGKKLVSHEGGFLPFSADITDTVEYGDMNHLAVKVNNELAETRMPCGQTRILPDGTKRAMPYFDFFNYSGLQRSVWLTSLPKNRIDDYDLNYTLKGEDAEVSYKVYAAGTDGDAASKNMKCIVQLYDADGVKVAEEEGTNGILRVRRAHLWKVRDAYLYSIVIRLKNDDLIIDEYREKIGIRTVEISGNKILLNGEPVYLKGFGKHEDADIIGRGTSLAVMKRDFELMKWTGANSFRTSHYPYSEEIYQMADREGFLVIDEVQAVGCFPSLTNFVDANSGKKTAFFEKETTPLLMEHHKRSIEEMIRRDKNHACVIAWSLLNEPESSDDFAREYFKEIFDYALRCDPQKRPRTFALLMNSRPDTCKCHQFTDLLCLNRYYGWYVKGGMNLSEAERLFRKEMDAWMEVAADKPIVFTEYGADSLAGIEKLPDVMWSEGYQIEVLKMCERVFDSYESVVGEQIWNFADFQTSEGIMRVDGNKKGVFTRQRQPKRAAFHLKERWDNLEK